MAKQKERRIRELHALRSREESLDSLRKVTDHQVDQLKGALNQLKTEAQSARNNLIRLQQSLGQLSLTYVFLR